MPDDATEGVVEHSSRLQRSINLNLHAPVTAFMFSCCVTDVLPRRDKGFGTSFLLSQKVSVLSDSID